MTINKTNSRSVLIQIILLIIILIGLIIFYRQDIYAFYSSSNNNDLGLFLNGLIVALFCFGLLRIMLVLLAYSGEQKAVDQLIKNLRGRHPKPTRGIKRSIAIRRYEQVSWINQQSAPINQGALASSLSASESTRFTLIRFVHSTLILSGVFGTVVSLSMALVGASGLLDSPENMQKMGMIIGGMSTALSTTVTAIVCFIIYAYFCLRLNDVKTRVLSNIEDMTSLYIIPRLVQSEETVIKDIGHLISALREASHNLVQVGEQLDQVVDDMSKQVHSVSAEMNEMKVLLKRGFRLYDQ